MRFVGEKIPAKKIINTKIKIIDYKIEPSKLKEGTDCLYLQIEKGGESRVVFVGSKFLINQITRVPKDKFPFDTTIKSDNDHYEFT
jgi:hypothetical protein